MNANSTGKLLDVQHVMVSFHIGGILGRHPPGGSQRHIVFAG